MNCYEKESYEPRVSSELLYLVIIVLFLTASANTMMNTTGYANYDLWINVIGEDIHIYEDNSPATITLRSKTVGYNQVVVPIRKGDYWRVEGREIKVEISKIENGRCEWLPVGNELQDAVNTAVNELLRG